MLATINDKCFPVYYILKNLKWSSDKSLNLQIGPRRRSKVGPLNVFVDISATISISLIVVKWHEFVFYDKNSDLMQENKDNTFLAFGIFRKISRIYSLVRTNILSVILIVSFNLSYLDYSGGIFFWYFFVIIKGSMTDCRSCFLLAKLVVKMIYFDSFHIKKKFVYKKPLLVKNLHYYNFYYLIQVQINIIFHLFVDHLYTFQIPHTD